MKHYVYGGFERFWHWTQAVLILFLALTGFEIHGSLAFFGFDEAVRYHSMAAYALMVLIAFAGFWHLTTGEWRQYVPSREHLKSQAAYYLVGIFRDEPHPTKKTVLSKLNPLQKITYAGLKVFLIPLVVVSGLVYMFYRYPQRYSVVTLEVGGLEWVAIAHTIGAFLLLAFLIAHIYLMTTGQTLTSNLKAMITGYEELPEADRDAAASDAGVQDVADFASRRT